MTADIYRDGHGKLNENCGGIDSNTSPAELMPVTRPKARPSGYVAPISQFRIEGRML